MKWSSGRILIVSEITATSAKHEERDLSKQIILRYLHSNVRQYIILNI